MRSACKSRLLLAAISIAAASSLAVTITEDFSANPLGRGWQIFGDTNLFHWDPTNQNLQVTWDSSQTNSYFYHDTGTILSREDDFQLSFDLVFQDYQLGTTPGKTNTFETAIGFLNLVNATQPTFSRGSGVNATYGPKNLVEFNFFPAFSVLSDTYPPTIDQVIVSTNNAWLYNQDNLLDMPPGDLFHMQLVYTAATRTLTTTTLRNGMQYGVVQTITVGTNFDFRVAAVSVSSYSDHYSDGGSILAHGTVGNIIFTVPPPPVAAVLGGFSNHVWRVQFNSRTNWVYTLDRASDLQSWAPVSPATSGNGTNLVLMDTNSATSKEFYRVRATRP
jgi:hypothetical protein